MLSRLLPGDSVELLLARHGQVLTLPAVVGESRPATYEIMLDEHFRSRELRRLESWLGQELTLNR